LEGLRFYYVEHILAVAYPQAPTMASMVLLSNTPSACAVILTTLCIYFCGDSLSPLDTHVDEVVRIHLFDLHALEARQQLVAELKP
jgi:hypothetical protein